MIKNSIEQSNKKSIKIRNIYEVLHKILTALIDF